MGRDRPADGKGRGREQPSHMQIIKGNENVLGINLADKQEEGGDVEATKTKSPFL